MAIFLAGYGMLKWELFPLLPGRLVDWGLFMDVHGGDHPSASLIALLIIGLPILVLGIIALVGGVSAIRRKRFGLSLAGAICALISGLLGILAVIFIALGKREFRGEGLSGI